MVWTLFDYCAHHTPQPRGGCLPSCARAEPLLACAQTASRPARGRTQPARSASSTSAASRRRRPTGTARTGCSRSRTALPTRRSRQPTSISSTLSRCAAPPPPPAAPFARRGLFVFDDHGMGAAHLQTWDSSNLDPESSGKNVTIQVYSDMPSVELFVNGESEGVRELHSVAPALAGGDTWAEW